VGAIVVIADPDHPEVVGSGVLIHPRVLLTAGHVTITSERLLRDGVPLFEVSRISFGTDAFDLSSWVEAVAVMPHPGFEGDAHDLGVVILKEPVDLPCATLADDGRGWAVRLRTEGRKAAPYMDRPIAKHRRARPSQPS
jgi:hypothetical protein